MAQVDATRISVSNEAGEDLPKCTLKFQCGLLRETETFLGDDVRYLCTDSVLEYVNDMLYFKVEIVCCCKPTTCMSAKCQNVQEFPLYLVTVCP